MSRTPADKSGLTFGAARELLLPAMVFGGFGLYYFAEQPMWVVLACAAPVIVLYAVAPLWAARSLAAFDRDSVRILASRDPKRLQARYARALGMRLFAEPGALAARKAMVLLECGAFRAARTAFADALDELGATAPDRVVLGAAHASFAVADYASAVTLYRRVLAGVGALPGVERKLALALVRHGEDMAVAVELLERTTGEAAEGVARQEHLLTSALAHAKLGDARLARLALERAQEQGELTSAVAQELRSEIVERLDSGRGSQTG